MTALLASFTYTPMQRWGPVSPHGVGTALGFFLGAYLMARRAEPRGIPKPEVYNAVTWGALGAIVGARGFYVLGHLDQFHSVRDMVAVWEGGLTMFGGFVGGLLLGLWYLKRHGFNIPTAVDAAAPGFVVGVIIGRLGDIAIADHLGNPTNFPLGYKIPNAPLAPGYGPPTYVPGAVVHHTAVYDLAGALVLFAFLYWLDKRKPRTGTLFAAFSVWYGLQRFLIDFTRNRDTIESFFLGLSGSQWAGLAFALGGVIALIRIRRKPTVEPVLEPVPAGVIASMVPVEPPPGAVPEARIPDAPVHPAPIESVPHAMPIDPSVPVDPPAPAIAEPPEPPSAEPAEPAVASEPVEPAQPVEPASADPPPSTDGGGSPPSTTEPPTSPPPVAPPGA
jgi:phosphatidylglycerol:prolipoprotein diacylglycerol transferase